MTEGGEILDEEESSSKAEVNLLHYWRGRCKIRSAVGVIIFGKWKYHCKKKLALREGRGHNFCRKNILCNTSRIFSLPQRKNNFPRKCFDPGGRNHTDPADTDPHNWHGMGKNLCLIKLLTQGIYFFSRLSMFMPINVSRFSNNQTRFKILVACYRFWPPHLP